MASLIVVEDHKRTKDLLSRNLASQKHIIIGGIAEKRNDIERIIDQIITNNLQVDFILLDHNLIDIKGDTILQMFRSSGILSPIIGISGTESQEYADFRIRKRTKEFEKIGEIITELKKGINQISVLGQKEEKT